MISMVVCAFPDTCTHIYTNKNMFKSFILYSCKTVLKDRNCDRIDMICLNLIWFFLSSQLQKFSLRSRTVKLWTAGLSGSLPTSCEYPQCHTHPFIYKLRNPSAKVWVKLSGEENVCTMSLDHWVNDLSLQMSYRCCAPLYSDSLYGLIVVVQFEWVIKTEKREFVSHKYLRCWLMEDFWTFSGSSLKVHCPKNKSLRYHCDIFISPSFSLSVCFLLFLSVECS